VAWVSEGLYVLIVQQVLEELSVQEVVELMEM